MKILIDELLPLTKKLSADWTPLFLRHNIEKYVKPLYEYWDTETANTIVAFIILAYSKESTWVRNHKDRLENKIEIFSTLLGNTDELPEHFMQVVIGKDVVANEVIESWLRLQQDWRIPQIETYRNFQAHMRLLASRLDDDIQRNINLGKAMEEGRKRREEADELQRSFDSDFKDLDNALEAEGRSKLSEIPSNQLSWEQYISLRNQQREEKNKKE